MSPRVLVSLRDSVVFEEEGSEAVRLWDGEAKTSLRLSRGTPGLRFALEALRQRRRTVAEIGGEVTKLESFAGLARFREHLGEMEACGFLEYALVLDERELLTVRGVSTSFRFRRHEIEPGVPYVLSRFAYVRRDHSQGMMLASPTAHAVAHLSDPATLSAIYRISSPACALELQEVSPQFDVETAQALLSFLKNVGAIVEVGPDGWTDEDTDPALAQWGFHDLTFHANCRLGRGGGPDAVTGGNGERFAPLPMVKPAASDEIVYLYRPDLERLEREDASFTEVLERRRSVRKYGDLSIHVDQLGEFLFRSARVKRTFSSGGRSWRPSPAGGGIHEIEIYPFVHECEGLAAGVYHYDPFDHVLSVVKTDEVDAIRRLLRGAAVIGLLDREFPPVLLVFSARFQRIQRRYGPVAYSLILKHVGALTQTMYLVAEAMGLAGCALGGGDSDLFAKVIGSDYYAETSVGEFLLGSGPSDRPEPFAAAFP